MQWMNYYIDIPKLQQMNLPEVSISIQRRLAPNSHGLSANCHLRLININCYYI